MGIQKELLPKTSIAHRLAYIIVIYWADLLGCCAIYIYFIRSVFLLDKFRCVISCSHSVARRDVDLTAAFIDIFSSTGMHGETHGNGNA